MRPVYLQTLFCLLLGWPALGPNCPPFSDKEAVLRFLVKHKSHSTSADPTCVGRAFASLSDDVSHTDALVNLLDFERFTKDDEKLVGRPSQYRQPQPDGWT